MARTRRRARYTWLPTIGTIGPGDPAIDNSSGRTFSLVSRADGLSDVIISPITFDEPLEGDNLTTTGVTTPLGTILGNEYFLKRIVGKLFIEAAAQQNEDNSPSTIAATLVGAGFFIARADDAQAGGSGTPIGSQSIQQLRENYSPLAEDTIREPWIWRRTWILANPAIQELQRTNAAAGVATNGTPGLFFPTTTAGYGSVADGPHIDAKTARRIKQDERLWFVVAARPAPFSVITAGADNEIRGYLDFRLLGALRKAKQGSAF